MAPKKLQTPIAGQRSIAAFFTPASKVSGRPAPDSATAPGALFPRDSRASGG